MSDAFFTDNTGDEPTSFEFVNVTQYTLSGGGLHINNIDDYILAEDGHIDNPPEAMTAIVGVDPQKTLSFQDYQTLLAAFTFLRADQGYLNNETSWKASSVIATECGLYLCLKKYEPRVISGILVEQTQEVSRQRASESYTPLVPVANSSITGTTNWNPIYHEYYVPRTDFQLVYHVTNDSWLSSSPYFNITQDFLLSTSDFLGALLPPMNNTMTSDKKFLPQNVYIKEGLRYSSQILQPLYFSEDLSRMFEVVAQSLTLSFRNAANRTQEIGISYRWTLYYEIRWQYLSLPVTAFVGKKL